jgi:hypothetical protein
MNQAYRLINQAELLVATEYQGHLGKGVCDEICYALSKKKLVYVLRSGESCEERSNPTTAFNGRLFRVYSKHQLEIVDISWQVHYARVYEGFLIPPLLGAMR